MATIAQRKLFSWKEIDAASDLDRLRLVLSALSLVDEDLMVHLEKQRGNGRDDYPIRPVWNAMIAGIVYQHPHIESLRRELRRNGELRQVLGFDVFRGEAAVPTQDAFSRFLRLLMKNEEHLLVMFHRLLDALKIHLPDLGEKTAVDSKAVPSFGKPVKDTRKRTTVEPLWSASTVASTASWALSYTPCHARHGAGTNPNRSSRQNALPGIARRPGSLSVDSKNLLLPIFQGPSAPESALRDAFIGRRLPQDGGLCSSISIFDHDHSLKMALLGFKMRTSRMPHFIWNPDLFLELIPSLSVYCDSTRMNVQDVSKSQGVIMMKQLTGLFSALLITVGSVQGIMGQDDWNNDGPASWPGEASAEAVAEENEPQSDPADPEESGATSDTSGDYTLTLREKEDQGYHYVGARLRWIFVPEWFVSMFGVDIITNNRPMVSNVGIGAEYIYRKNNFDITAAIWWSKLDWDGSISFKGKGERDISWEIVESNLSALLLTADFIWSTPIRDWVAITYGVGLGFGFGIGELRRTEAQTGEILRGDGSTFRPDPDLAPGTVKCNGLNDPAGDTGCMEGEFNRVYDKIKVVPWINFLVGVRFKPHEHMAIYLDGGFGLGFQMGMRAGYLF